MKKLICLLLIALLLFTGCQTQAPETTAPGETDATEETTVAPEVTTQPEEETTMPILPTINPGFMTEPRNSIAFANPGKARIAYTGNRSYVKYITSAEDLPNEEALAGYDEAFFEDHALVIVVETVSSGSVQLQIDSIEASGDTAVVSLKRSMPGEVGTTDMATWLLWAEVEKGLEYTWSLENASQLPAGEKY